MIGGKERQPGSDIASALLLQEQEEEDSADSSPASEEVIFATTLVIIRCPDGTLDVSPLKECEVEGKTFRPDPRMLEMMVTVLQGDLQTAKVVRALAEALTSQES